MEKLFGLSIRVRCQSWETDNCLQGEQIEGLSGSPFSCKTFPRPANTTLVSVSVGAEETLTPSLILSTAEQGSRHMGISSHLGPLAQNML